MNGRLPLAVAMLLLGAGPALAHGGAHEPIGWEFDPWVATPLLLSGLLYAAGTTALWRRAGVGRGIHRWQVAAYTAGWLALAGAVVSPLHELAEKLFTAHMIEHEIVMAVAAPLLALARPIGAFLWALPPGLRRGLGDAARRPALRSAWRFVTTPLTATALHGVSIWLWHIPALFDLAVQNLTVHRLQHLTFLLTALLFWWALVRACQPGTAAAHLFITMLHTGALGALMVLAPRVLYRVQTADAPLWGLTPLDDQQLAGLVMWIPAGTVYAGAALAFLALWIRRVGVRENAYALR